MSKPKTWMDHARSLEADWPPRQTITLTDLVAEARAAEWDFTNWCYASGYDASDPDVRRMFECLLAYAMREGERRQQHGRDDEGLQHWSSPAVNRALG